MKEFFFISQSGNPGDFYRIIIMRKWNCFCRFAKYFNNETLTFIAKIDSICNYNLDMSCCDRHFYFPCHKNRIYWSFLTNFMFKQPGCVSSRSTVFWTNKLRLRSEINSHQSRLNYLQFNCSSYFVIYPWMSLRRVRKKVDYAKFCQDEDDNTNNSDGEFTRRLYKNISLHV